MADLQTVGGAATIGLGLSQALLPRTAAKVFGLPGLTDREAWLARLLGVSNVALGSLALDTERRGELIAVTRGVLAANAAVTLLAGARGGISKRTAATVLAFLGVLAVAEAVADAD